MKSYRSGGTSGLVRIVSIKRVLREILWRMALSLQFPVANSYEVCDPFLRFLSCIAGMCALDHFALPLVFTSTQYGVILCPCIPA